MYRLELLKPIFGILSLASCHEILKAVENVLFTPLIANRCCSRHTFQLSITIIKHDENNCIKIYHLVNTVLNDEVTNSLNRYENRYMETGRDN